MLTIVTTPGKGTPVHRPCVDAGCLLDWIERIRHGDQLAHEELLRHFQGALERRARGMLNTFAHLQRWTSAEDVLQNALLRLLRALNTATPASAREFLGLASLQIRRELLDLHRHFFGPLGIAANHASDYREADSAEPVGPLYDRADSTYDPADLALWTELQAQIDALPEREREVFHLHYYDDLPLTAVARVLGMSRSTVDRDWVSACARLGTALEGACP